MTQTHPQARKLRPPRNRGWISGHAEYRIDGEANRFRYVTDFGWSVADPGRGSNGERRVLAIVGARAASHPRGASNGAVACFEELANRPLGDNTTRALS